MKPFNFNPAKILPHVFECDAKPEFGMCAGLNVGQLHRSGCRLLM